jgi:ADP-heptose:LPS heptosyltransferase
MQHILIINLDGPDSILLTAPFIVSLKTYYPASEISFLSFGEENEYCKMLPSIEHFFQIEKKKIKTFLKGKIFPDAQAINSLEKTLSNICGQNWDNIIHTGFSLEGALISSYISLKSITSNFYGIKFESTKKLYPSNLWFIIQQSLMNYKFNPLNPTEYLHLGNNLFFDPQIPRRNSGHKKIGILLPTNPEDDFLPFQTLVELIDHLRNSGGYFPVLLVDFQKINREYFTKLNRYFNYELEIIYTNFENAKKTLAFLDYFITGHSRLKYLAHSEGISIIEITDNMETSLIGPKNIILKKGSDRIKGLDIFNCLEGNFYLNSVDIQLFSCSQDRVGYRLQRLHGKFSFHEEISRLMARYLIGALYLQERDETILSDIADFPQKEASDWIENQKNLNNEVSGKLLNILRLLSLVEEGDSYKKDLIINLDDLLSFSNSESLNAIPILIFKYKIEYSPINELKIFENNIFALKEQIQVVISSIRDLEGQVWNKKKESLIKKAFGNRVNLNEELPQ